LQDSSLVSLFMWSNEEFLKNTEGSPIRRIGHERWLRNLAVGLGNASASNHILEALRLRKDHPSLLVREHVNWAIKEQRAKLQCE
jgi:epoxyqueuosine reductase